MEEFVYNLEKFEREVETGELFGIFVECKHIYTIYPLIEENLKDLGVRYNVRLLDNSWAGCEVLKDIEGIPLILKKISEIYAQEVLTGNVFVIGNSNQINRKINEIKGDVRNFQSFTDKHENCKIVIYTEDYKGKYTGTINYQYVVDDKFKALYANCVLKNREKFIATINESVDKARKVYNKKFEKDISDLQDIAISENLVFDFDKQYIINN